MREHKILGPIVDGLSELAVSSYDQISRLIDEGNKYDSLKTEYIRYLVTCAEDLA